MTKRILIHAMGSGETTQAYAVAKYFYQNNISVHLCLKEESTAKFLINSEFKLQYRITPTVKDLKDYVKKLQPDTIIFCNSKSFKRDGNFVRLKRSPFPGVKIVTLDSNWLFNYKFKRFPFILWADRYFVNIPKPIFLKGLRENGGYFHIPKNIYNRIESIGFIPSYQKPDRSKILSIRKNLGIKSDQKLIFCYISGSGAAGKPWIIKNLLKAVLLLKIKTKIKILCIGNNSLIPPAILEEFNKTLIHPDTINIDKYYQFIASSDLVFQHQGLSTLYQAISAQVPVIANVSIYPNTDMKGIHPAEIKPFSKSNLCRILFKSTPVQKIAQQINELLFNENAIKAMRVAQKDNYSNSNGEKKLLEALMQNNI